MYSIYLQRHFISLKAEKMLYYTFYVKVKLYTSSVDWMYHCYYIYSKTKQNNYSNNLEKQQTTTKTIQFIFLNYFHELLSLKYIKSTTVPFWFDESQTRSWSNSLPSSDTQTGAQSFSHLLTSLSHHQCTLPTPLSSSSKQQHLENWIMMPF